ncbi:MAG: RNHCP domain-containing protein [Chloroflexi bacterium]|nr:MAG: RNHCP domain-containing protein [Chloroflexota bacterium]
MKTRFSPQHLHRSAKSTFGDFVCLRCHRFVSAEPALSGVQNRNHCPYCLSSRHLDLYEPGDRLSACKAIMRPIGLTLKKSAKKYLQPGQGEMMLIHLCDDCGKVSINRLAADDFADTILEIFETSQRLDARAKSQLAMSSIIVLQNADHALVYRRLFGRNQAFSSPIFLK